MKKTTISVALCTYNGERYLQEQLDSIACQDLLPDELIIVDDVSQDATPQLVEAFGLRVSFPVRLLINETNLGSTKNFEKAVRHCTGDLLVFSDQDDLWRADRLARTVEFFENNPTKEVLFSDAEIIDDHSQLVGRRIWEEVQFDAEAQARWRSGLAHELLFNGYVVTGATMAMRRSLLPEVLPFPTHIKNLIHDGWISLIAALRGTIDFISDPLIQYRQHQAQQVGFKAPRKKVTLWDRLVRERHDKLSFIEADAVRCRQLYDLLANRPDVPLQKLDLLASKRDHLYHRATLPAQHFLRIGPVWKEYKRGNYRRFNGYWIHTVLGDLLEK